MSTPYFPGLFLDEEDPSSRFLDLFNRFGGQYPDIGQFLQPDDPQLLEYQKLASSPTGSEELISSYIEQLPTREEYKPSFGRKMAAFALGALSGSPAAASEIARRHVERPYEQAIEDWKLEGSNIASRARLMDTSRNRQLQAIKYGLQTKAGTAKTEAMQNFRKLQEARRLADEVAAEERSEQARIDREEQERWRRGLSESVFKQRKSMDEWRKAEAASDNTRAEEAAKRTVEERAARERDFDKINKDLSAWASQQGINTSNKTALEIAREAALTKATSYGAFKDILVKDDSIEGGYRVNTHNQYIKDALTKFIDMQVRKYLRGEF